MKILIINNGYPKPEEPTIYVFVHKQASILKKNGNDVYVLDIDLRSFRWKRRFGIYTSTYETIPVYHFSFPFITTKFRKIGKFLNQKIAIYMYKKLRRKVGDFDIIHGHFGFGAGNATIAIKKEFCVPAIITEHSTKVLYSKSAKEIRYFIDAYNSANKLIVVSNALKKKLSSYEINKCIVIPNVIDESKFMNMNTNKKEKQHFTIISVGHLIPRKNQIVLLEALNLLNQDEKNIKVILIGKGPEKGRLIEYAKSHCLDNIVEFHDFIDNNELQRWYNDADCFVLPSLVETFGIVYAEAICCGIPAISYNNGGVDDIINDSNGIIYEKNDPVLLADSIKYVMENQNKYKSIQLHQDIIDRFGSDFFYKKIINIYEEVINT